jgi:hypothetical protein
MNPLLRRAFSSAFNASGKVADAASSKTGNFFGRALGQLRGGPYRAYLKEGEQSVPEALRNFVRNPVHAMREGHKSMSRTDKMLMGGATALFDAPTIIRPKDGETRAGAIGSSAGMLAGSVLFNRVPLVGNIVGTMGTGALGHAIGKRLTGG